MGMKPLSSTPADFGVTRVIKERVNIYTKSTKRQNHDQNRVSDA